ncbi:MAG: arylsulfatase [Planctomycetota bacterium]|nr:MAG: arylsulfatase [Planctomycetota bacterium]
MRHPKVFKVLGLYSVILTVPGCLGAAPPIAKGRPADKPNIVFILADDLGWRDVSYHGSEIATPNIDRLAAGGTRLNQFYTQPICTPTRTCLMTGRYPIRYGMQVGLVRPWGKYALPAEERTLAEALKEAGYFTAICGKWHIGHQSKDVIPTAQGFDYQYGFLHGAIDYYKHLVRGNAGRDWSRNGKPIYEEGYATDLIAAEAIGLIEKHDFSKPMFLYLPFNAPHGPVKGRDGTPQAPKKYIDKYEHIKNEGRQIHAAMTDCLDEAIGNIIAALNKRGMRDNTLIIFCSDNGGGGHGKPDTVPLRGEKNSLYEGGVRVPALAYWPGKIKAGAIVDKPLHIVDMYPTLIKLAGGSLAQPLLLDGLDAWATIAHGAPSPHEDILINSAPYTGAVRCGNWKVVHNGHLPGASYEGPPVKENKYELFNLKDDPYEKNNLAKKFPKKLEQLKIILDKYNRQAAKIRLNPNYPPGGLENWKPPKVWGKFD